MHTTLHKSLLKDHLGFSVTLINKGGLRILRKVKFGVGGKASVIKGVQLNHHTPGKQQLYFTSYYNLTMCI